MISQIGKLTVICLLGVIGNLQPCLGFNHGRDWSGVGEDDWDSSAGDYSSIRIAYNYYGGSNNYGGGWTGNVGDDASSSFKYDKQEGWGSSNSYPTTSVGSSTSDSGNKGGNHQSQYEIGGVLNLSGRPLEIPESSVHNVDIQNADGTHQTIKRVGGIIQL